MPCYVDEMPINSPNNCNLYWNTYKNNYPEKAADILALGVIMESLSDEDTEEKIKAIEHGAQKFKCSIYDLKNKYQLLVHYSNNKLSSLTLFNQGIYKEAEELQIKTTNTLYSLFFKWVLNEIQIEETQNKYKALSDKSPKELAMMFSLESDDDLLMLQKLHVYHKGYPRESIHYIFIWDIEKRLDKAIKAGLKPFLESEGIRNDKDSFNLALEMHLSLIKDSLENTNNLESLIKDCNKHMVSFYVELDLALNRARKNYKLKYIQYHFVQ